MINVSFPNPMIYAANILAVGFLLPTFSHAAAKPINFNCASVNYEEVMLVGRLLERTIPSDLQNDPIAMLIAAALNQRYGKDFRMQDIQHLRENSLYELSFPLRSDFIEIRKVIQEMGFNATGFRFVGNAIGVRQGDVGFLLDTHVHFNRTPVMALLLAVSADKRHVLYGDGTICPMEKMQFEQRFADSKFLRLD